MRSSRRDPSRSLQRPSGRDQRLHPRQRDHEGAPQARAQEALFLAVRSRRRRPQDRHRSSRR